MDENKNILNIAEVLSVIDELVHIYGVALPTTLPRDVRIPLNLLMYRLLSANTTINLNGKTLTFTDNDSEILIEITNTISGKSASFTINELVSIACDAYAITINTTGIELTTDKTLRYPSDLSAQTMDDKDIPPVKWIRSEITDAVVGLYDDRGNYDASSNLFPSTGGSGTGGAILKGDIWTISVEGTLGGTDVIIGQTVRALVDTPGQTVGNWAVSVGSSSINDEAQAWSSSITFDKNYGSFNTNAHTQTAQIDFAVSFTSAVFGAVTHRIIVSNGDDFIFPSGYITINTDGATGTKSINTFTPIAERQYRIIFECIDVLNSKYNVVIIDSELTAQLNTPVLSSATLDAGNDIDLVYTDTNSYPPEVQIEIQTDTVNTFDSGNEFSEFAAKDSTGYTVTCPLAGTLYYFRVRAVGDGINTQTSAWSNIESATTATDIIVMEDDFAGTTIDVLKWTETDPADDVTVSQNNALIFTKLGNNTVNYTNNNVLSVDSIDTGAISCFMYTYGAESKDAQKAMELRIDDNNRVILAKSGTTTGYTTRILVYDNGSLISDQDITSIDLRNKQWKIAWDGVDLKVSYWNGSSWTQAGSTVNPASWSGNKYARIECGDAPTDSAGSVTFGLFYMTNADYSTQYPG